MKGLSNICLKAGVVITFVIVMLLAINLTAEGQAKKPKHYAEINGTRVDLAPGKVVAHGKKLDNGRCDLPASFKVVSEATQEVDEGTAILQITEKCLLVVERADWSKNGKKTASFLNLFSRVAQAAAYHIRGETNAQMEDAADFAVTKTIARISFFDDNATVWGGHDPFHECQWFWLSGWANDGCWGGNSPTGPTYIDSWTTGDFHNNYCAPPDFCSRRTSGDFFAQPSLNYVATCWFIESNPPPLLHYRCLLKWQTI